MLETEEKDHPKLVTGEAFRDGLRQFVKGPFRLEPYFDPGVWGGHWMQENFGVGQEKENLAWSFDGVPEEKLCQHAVWRYHGEDSGHECDTLLPKGTSG